MTSLMSCIWVASICYTQSIAEAFAKSTQWAFPESGHEKNKKRLWTWLKIDPTSSLFWRGKWDLKMTWAQPNCTEVFVCMCIHIHICTYIFWLHICIYMYTYMYEYHSLGGCQSSLFTSFHICSPSVQHLLLKSSWKESYGCLKHRFEKQGV